MNILRNLFRWGGLYILIGLLLYAIYWQENLQVGQGTHDVISGAILLIFGFLLIQWVSHHPANFLEPPFNSPQNASDRQKDDLNKVGKAEKK